MTAAAGESPGEDELRDFARERLARFKVPKRIEVVDELPKTGTGKIQKFLLREQAADGAGRERGRGVPAVDTGRIFNQVVYQLGR